MKLNLLNFQIILKRDNHIYLIQSKNQIIIFSQFYICIYRVFDLNVCTFN